MPQVRSLSLTGTLRGFAAPRPLGKRYKQGGSVKISIWIIAVFLLLISNPILACGGAEYPVMSTSMDDGTKIGLFILQEQIEKTQEWSPENGEPPLSISAAYQAAISYGRKKYTRYDDVKVREISIKKYGCSLVSNRWYYVIDLTPIIDGNVVFSRGAWVAVLMDSSVIGSRKY